MYTIGQVSETTGLPVSTLRYYDKEGLFPHLERKGYVRKFSDTELEEVRIIECLKRSGLEIKDIRQFFQWVSEGSSTYGKRRELFARQRDVIQHKIEALEKTMAMLEFKCWYYDKAMQDGNEDELRKMLPDNLPEEIQRIYDKAHEQDKV
ncbi:MerR family transcriptional regulator [Ligilactobacillus sp.]|uniref:MerR family transcriptional regulator n=1 Tax=Ligilactobacillus sp. TaxID=2767921 RepID=UPI002FE33457